MYTSKMYAGVDCGGFLMIQVIRMMVCRFNLLYMYSHWKHCVQCSYCRDHSP